MKNELTVQLLGRFFDENNSRLRRLMDRRDTSIGFNAFAIMSDTYRRENFHSDVIAAILDPTSAHGEGTLFLRKFVAFLSERARAQGKPKLADSLDRLAYDEAIQVVREDGRVDIKVKSPSWTIIVENKINGAGDMQRQIPRYLEDCHDKGENVVAAVYLQAAEERRPGRGDWKEGDLEAVDSVLISVAGFSESLSGRNLVEGWLEPCQLIANNFSAKSVLAQYAELVKYQAGETMDQNELSKVLASMGKMGLSYSELRQILESVPHAVAGMIVDAFKDRKDLKKVWIYSDDVAVLDFVDIVVGRKKVSFAIDVCCGDLASNGVSFFSRTADKVPLFNYAEIMQECDSRFGFDSVYGGDRIAFTCDQDQAFSDVPGLIKRLAKIVDFIVKNRARFEAIASGE